MNEFTNEEDVRKYIKDVKGVAHILRYPKYKFVVETVNRLTSFLCSHTKLGLRIKMINDAIDELPYCPICLENRIVVELDGSRLTKTCGSTYCVNQLKAVSVKETVAKDDMFYQKRNEVTRKSSIEKYGVDNYMKTEEGKQKIRDAITEEAKEKRRIGIKTAWEERREEINSLRKEGIYKKYGVEHVMQLPEIAKKAKKTNMENNGGIHSLATEETRAKRRLVSSGLFTLSEFIDKSQEVHGEFYDYSRVVYTGIYAKVEIGCAIHGTFSQTAFHHLRGSGCQECAKRKITVHQIDGMTLEEKNLPYYLYHVRFTKDGDSFDKIGITKHSTIDHRFGSTEYNDYDIRLINMKCGRKEDILLEEIDILDEMSNDRFRLSHMKGEFNGWTECFLVEEYDPSSHFV